MTRRPLLLACGAAALLGAACLDSLYEDTDPPAPAGGWFVCCRFGRVSTCACDSASGCAQDLLPCAGGTCLAPGAGTCGGSDAGGGNDGGTVGDGGLPPTIETCCTPAGAVSTCACTPSGCDGGSRTFTACRLDSCVPSGGCP